MARRTAGRWALALATAIAVAGCGSAGPDQAQSTPASTPASVAASESATSAPPQSLLIQPPSIALRAGERFVTLQMPAAYHPSAPTGGTDDYRCFVIDPGLTQDTFLTGTQFFPQNPALVHHAIMFYLPPDQVQAAQALDDSTPGQGWTCFGGAGVGGAGDQGLDAVPWVGAWAPGGKEGVSPAGTGRKLEAGSRIILQVHYNLLNATQAPSTTDRSGVRLRLAPAGARLKQLETMLLLAPVELPCPSGQTGPLCDRQKAELDLVQRFGAESAATVEGLQLLCGDGSGRPKPGPTQSCTRPVQQREVIHGIAGHMHLLGRSIRVDLNPGTPSARTLLNVPVYNFDNQNPHWLAKPVVVKPGDRMRVTCTHDAGLRQMLPALRSLPPRYVLWGEGTSDEMCLAVVTWSNS
jgi:predicted small lipoprotein YifL